MKSREYAVKNLHCSGCSALIQGNILKLPGVLGVNIDIYEEKMLLQYEESIEEDSLLQTINQIADKIEPGTLFYKKEEGKEEENTKEILYKSFSFLGMIVFFISAWFSSNENLQFLFYFLSYLSISWDILWRAANNLSKGKWLDENFLMTIATLGAIYLQEYHEAIGVMFFYKIGEFLEEKAVKKSKKSISSLLELRPEKAIKKYENGKLEEVESSSLELGDILILKEGERVPVDAKIISGESYLDTSALTGESLPVDVKVGDIVLSGSINGDRILELEVIKKYEDSTISKIIDMVENANNKKSQAEKFMTRFAKYYTPFVVSCALIVGLLFPIAFGNFKLWFERAILFLVISCPCALVISIPLTFFTNIGRASKEGILIKGAHYLEGILDIKNIVFDKTGTLTKASFQVEMIGGENQEEIKEFAKAGEFYSTHPIGKAIYESFPHIIDEKEIQNYKNLPGYGVELLYKGKHLFLGNEKYLIENSISHPNVKEYGSIIFLVQENQYRGFLVIRDQIKEEAKSTLARLKKLGFTSYILTGDTELVASSVGNILGVVKENILSNLLPSEKVEKLKTIKQNGKTLYIGDGINDAPVLALADIGIAMGAMGSDIAIEASDIVFMDDHLEKIITLFEISKQTRKKLWVNISFALLIKISVMILGVLGLANMWFAIFADVGVTLLCVLYAGIYFKK